MRFEKGLIVGKFCPLHKGHMWLIESALAACKKVLVISYTKPEFDRCESANRERWLAQLFPSITRLVMDDEKLQALCLAKKWAVRVLPHNDAPEDEHRDFVAWLCCDVLETSVDAVFTSENYGDGFADSLTAYFRRHRRSDKKVQHVCVDPLRHSVSISGTKIRADVFQQKQFLEPIVYADFIERVAILGGESSGKTTLAKMLADRLATAWVPEYGRTLWEEKNGELEFTDMLKIGKQQVALEQSMGYDATRWLFCDTTPLTTCFYSDEMFGAVDPELTRLASRDYQKIVLCAPDFTFVQDGTRRTTEFQQQQHHWYLRELEARNLEFIYATGSIAERLDFVASQLQIQNP